MNRTDALTLIALAALLTIAVMFARSCLADLARTPDEQLRILPRSGWAFLIIFTIPIGGILYLTYGRFPRRDA
jgi:hypothetical protein